MQLNFTVDKPSLLPGKALCKFRTSKAYLWGLVRDRLLALESERNKPVEILDAACHALITKEMFPKGCNYYGLDVAFTRLEKAKSLLATNDRLFWADLTRPLPFQQAFDAVVSCNTFSHLPFDQQPLATSNLIEACRSGGDLLINTGIDEGLMPLTQSLLKSFVSIEPIYFDSYLSQEKESVGAVNAQNVLELVNKNEVELQNDACLHRQVLLHARNRKCIPKLTSPPRTESALKILKLNKVPVLRRIAFQNDQALLADEQLWSNKVLVAFTAALAKSQPGSHIQHQLAQKGLEWKILDQEFEPSHLINQIVVLGLEDKWSLDGASERLAINKLREREGLEITFALVKMRAGKLCKPSLVADDI